MLHPKHDRIDYGEQLIPPPGYELVRAIGTTYSLELEALMVLPVALFYSQALEGSQEELRYDMLDGITRAADKITVYYQNGQLKVPSKYHHLMAYWEKGICPVTMPNHVSSFHPKVWVIRYECEGQPAKYRVLVTSRNLTFERDWDIALSTEGTVGDKEQARNKPLIHFLNYLNDIGGPSISADFIKELLYVKFDLPHKFDLLRFIPIGIDNPETKKKYKNPLTASKDTFWQELLIMSPFLDTTTLTSLYQSSIKRPFLLSTKSELDSISEELLGGFDAWQFSRFIEQAEHSPELSEENEGVMNQNLHAKLFVITIDDKSLWYLGSANCTDPAQGRNIEFMVELSGTSNGQTVRTVFNSLTKPTKTDDVELFTRYDPDLRVSVEEQKRIDLEVRKIKYDLSLCTFKGSVSQIEGATAYNLLIEIGTSGVTWPSVYTVKVKPLPEQLKSAVKIKPGIINVLDGFTGYPETLLSPFLEFEISKAGHALSSFLMTMEIELPESRLHRIFTSIIDSRDKFLKYLTFLLTGEETGLVEGGNGIDIKNPSENNSPQSFFDGAPVFEKLLIAASRYPEKLKSIDLLIQRLNSEKLDGDEPIVSPEFESFWEVFRNYSQNSSQR